MLARVVRLASSTCQYFPNFPVNIVLNNCIESYFESVEFHTDLRD